LIDLHSVACHVYFKDKVIHVEPITDMETLHAHISKALEQGDGSSTEASDIERSSGVGSSDLRGTGGGAGGSGAAGGAGGSSLHGVPVFTSPIDLDQVLEQAQSLPIEECFDYIWTVCEPHMA
jgi:hypothetical protein